MIVREQKDKILLMAIDVLALMLEIAGGNTEKLMQEFLDPQSI